MIHIILSTLFLFPTLLGWGLALESVIRKPSNELSSKLFMGIISITIIWSFVSFFLPLNFWIEAITIFLGIMFLILFKKNNQLNIKRKHLPKFLLFCALIIFVGSFYPFILDHFGYYIPTIKWITEFGLVKGIGNLDLILGQMSFWHVFQGGFSFFTDSYLRMNCILLLFFVNYIFEKERWIHLLFVPIFLLFIQSPSPDLPALLLTCYFLDLFFKEKRDFKLLLIYSTFIFVLKPTFLWVPLFTFLAMIVEKKFTLKNLFFPSVIIGLYLFKNIWTFGFPLFPSSALALDLIWQPDTNIMLESAKVGLMKTYDMQYTYEEILMFRNWESTYHWLTLKGIKAYINSALIITWVVFFMYTLKKRNPIIGLLFVSISIKTILVLSFSAQYRFFLDIFLVVFYIFFHSKINAKYTMLISCIGCCIVGLFFTFNTLLKTMVPSFRLGEYLGIFQWSQLYRPSTYEFLKYEKQQVGNLRFNISKHYPFNFDTPLPAISPSFVEQYYKAGIFPQLLDTEDIKKGFYHKKLTPEELSAVKLILDELEKTSTPKDK